MPENDLESDVVKLNANDSTYNCSTSNILRYTQILNLLSNMLQIIRGTL